MTDTSMPNIGHAAALGHAPGRTAPADSGLLLAMGLVYNVKPLRTKDRLYLDVRLIVLLFFVHLPWLNVLVENPVLQGR